MPVDGFQGVLVSSLLIYVPALRSKFWRNQNSDLKPVKRKDSLRHVPAFRSRFSSILISDLNWHIYRGRLRYHICQLLGREGVKKYTRKEASKIHNLEWKPSTNIENFFIFSVAKAMKANVRLSVSPSVSQSPKHLSFSELLLSTIEPINCQA